MAPAIIKLITVAKRRKRIPKAEIYRRLLSDKSPDRSAAIPRGYLPVLVVGGNGEDAAGERFLVHVNTLKNPSMAALFQKAAEEYGYGQAGILRIPCGVEHFRRTVQLIG